MRKIVLALAAVAAFGLAVPFTAPAQAEEGKLVIRTGDRDRDHDRRWHRDRDEGRYFHRHRDRDRVVIIKKRRDRDRD